jgi:zinc protease
MLNNSRRSLPGPDDVALRRLENGILLAARENFASPAIVMRGILQSGALDEPSQKAGLASMVASLATRGTHPYDYDALNDAIEGVGASVGIGGGTHTTAVYTKSLAEDFPLMLDLSAGMLRHPTFPEEHFERIRNQRITALRERLNNTRAVADLLFYQTAYPPGHPYHQDPSGTPESIALLTRQDLCEFHQQQYGPDSAVFVVVGAIERQSALDQLEHVLADWEPLPNRSTAREAPPVAWPETALHQFQEMPGKSQSDIIYGLPTIPRNHPDFLALRLANTVLGIFGMMGRIGKKVRDELGLAYYARSSLDGTLGPSAWSASAGVAPEQVDQATAAIRAEWLRLASEPVPDAELNDSKSLMSGSLPLGLETNEGVARALLDILYYDLGLDYLQRYEETLRAISAERVREVSSRYFDVDRAITAVAGPSQPGT